MPNTQKYQEMKKLTFTESFHRYNPVTNGGYQVVWNELFIDRPLERVSSINEFRERLFKAVPEFALIDWNNEDGPTLSGAGIAALLMWSEIPPMRPMDITMFEIKWFNNSEFNAHKFHNILLNTWGDKSWRSDIYKENIFENENLQNYAVKIYKNPISCCNKFNFGVVWDGQCVRVSEIGRHFWEHQVMTVMPQNNELANFINNYNIDLNNQLLYESKITNIIFKQQISTNVDSQCLSYLAAFVLGFGLVLSNDIKLPCEEYEQFEAELLKKLTNKILYNIDTNNDNNYINSNISCLINKTNSLFELNECLKNTAIKFNYLSQYINIHDITPTTEQHEFIAKRGIKYIK